ncbi:MAG: hypothetical protein ACUVWP_01425 [bacterium]
MKNIKNDIVKFIKEEIYIDLSLKKVSFINFLDNLYRVEPKSDRSFIFSCDKRGIKKCVISNSKRAKIAIRPKMIDKPILVRLTSKITLSGQSRLSFYFNIPNGYAIYSFFKEEKHILDEIKPKLRRIYYGDLTGEGNISYLYNTNWSIDLPSKIEKFEMLVNANILNIHSNVYEIGFIQLLPKDIQIYIENDIINTNKIIINVIRDDEVNIKYIPMPSIRGSKLLQDAESKDIKSIISMALDVNRYFRK